jgi:hypothetical protein
VVNQLYYSNGDIEDIGNHFDWSSHPTVDQLMDGIRNCGGGVTCANHSSTISIVKLISVSANSHGDLLMHDIIQNVFDKAIKMLPSGSYLYSKLSHALASLSFAQGDFDKVSRLHRFNSL